MAAASIGRGKCFVTFDSSPDWLGRRTGGNLVKAAHKGIHSRERERMLAPKHNSGESQVPTILDEKGFSRILDPTGSVPKSSLL